MGTPQVEDAASGGAGFVLKGSSILRRTKRTATRVFKLEIMVNVPAVPGIVLKGSTSRKRI